MHSATASIEQHITSTPVVSDAGHARAFEETYAWLGAIIKRVPITRVFDAAVLDTTGIPVSTAVTPLAKDLASHAGKGETAMAARVGAIMEAIERVSAEVIPSHRTSVATYHDLCSKGEPVLDPLDCDLPFGTQYDVDRRISWVMGWDLLAKRRVWVATDLVVSPASEGVCFGVETNGLASGNTYMEAIVHALYEVIERDALSCAIFDETYRPSRRSPAVRIDTATVTGRAGAWLRRLPAAHADIDVCDLTAENGVPVFSVSFRDRCFPSGPRRFEGFGASLDPTRALIRAITEAAQSHTVQTLGNRDTVEEGPTVATAAGPVTYKACPPGHAPADLLDELETLLGRLRSSACSHCIVVDLTNPSLNVPVVRVIVPGFAHPFGDTRRRPPLRLLRRLM